MSTGNPPVTRKGRPGPSGVQKLYLFRKKRLEEEFHPGELDPLDVFEQRRKTLLAESTGLERFAYQCFGPTFMRSLVLAIDPFKQFRYTRQFVSPYTRKRALYIPGSGARTHVRTTHDLVRGKAGTPLNPRPPTTEVKSTTTTSLNNSVLPDGAAIMQDSTYGTRKPDQHGYGAAEFFDYSYYAPPVSITFPVKYSRIHVATSAYDNFSEQITTRTQSATGTCARMTASQLSTLKQTEMDRIDQLMAKYALSLYEKCLPRHREFSLFREISELKDLPDTIKSSVESVVNLIKFGKSSRQLKIGDLSQEYLNQEFGWLPIYSAVKQLVEAPSKIAAKINRLQKRNGLLSTFSYGYSSSESVGSFPQWSFDTYPSELPSPTTESSCTRDFSVKVSVELIPQLPPLDIPGNARWFIDALGGNPQPIDVYNLVPWTWLIDWFSGLGDYVNLLNTVYISDDLVKTAFISAKTVCNIRSVCKRRYTYTYQVGPNSPTPPVISSTREYTENAVLRTSAYKRMFLPDVLALNTPFDLSSVTDPMKASILWALITKGS